MKNLENDWNADATFGRYRDDLKKGLNTLKGDAKNLANQAG